jgi:hypothetical protein
MVPFAPGFSSPAKPVIKSYRSVKKSIGGLSRRKLPITSCWQCHQQHGRSVKLLPQRRLLRPMYAGNHQSDSVDKSTAHSIEEEDEHQMSAEKRLEEAAEVDSVGVR